MVRVSPGPDSSMEALLTSLGVIAVAEIGDKTQLLSLALASRFRRPVPIILGILVATLANHTAAGLVGAWIGAQLAPSLLRWVLGFSFLGMAVWALVPDRPPDEVAGRRHGAFIATAISFFLAEIGDKTQIATVALAARFDALLPVIVGTTAGMLAANVPAVLCGHYAGYRLDARWMRYAAAALFAAQAGWTLAGYEIPA